MLQFSSWYSLIVLTSRATSPPRSESMWTNSSFKVAFGITCTMNFVCSIFLIPVCGLKTQLRSTISLPLASQKTLMLQSLIALFLQSTRLSFITHTHWHWVSALVAVIWSHRFNLLHLKDASTHDMKWLFTHSRPSFCFPLKSCTLRHLILLFRNS